MVPPTEDTGQNAAPDPTLPYDLIVIGTGSANTILDERFESWRIAIVERDVFGGTCLNRGCIPSKMFIYPADVIAEMRHLSTLGVDVGVNGVRWTNLRDRVFSRIDAISAGGEEYRRGQSHIDVYGGDASFIGQKTLQVAGPDGEITVLTGDRFVLAAGARPTIPEITGLDEVAFHTSDTIMRIDEVPRRLGIIGGGFIAAEQADFFEAFGSAVTMIVRGPALLREEDEEVSLRFTQQTAKRLDLRLHSQVISVRQLGHGPTSEIELTVATDGHPDAIVVVDELLVATGRTPNGRQLNVTATGVMLDTDGLVVTDDHLRTEVDGIFALGDIRTPLQLKHVANHEAKIVQHNLLHPDDLKAIDERAVPHAVFTSPQIASVGMTSQAARMAGLEVHIGRREFGGTAYGWAMEDTVGFAKVLVEPMTLEILGAHIIGHQAALLLQPLVQGMRFGQSAEAVATGQMWPHPALSEVVENALLDGLTP